MICFNKYLKEVWNTDDLEDVDMSHGYSSYSSLSGFPTNIDNHDLHQFRSEMLNAHVAAGGDWKDFNDLTHPSPHVQRYAEREREFGRRSHETQTAHPNDETKLIKTMRHSYKYPTLEDIERIKKSAVNGMVRETKYDYEGQKMHPADHVLKNIHKFPGHHSGSISFVEYEGKPTDVYISEHGRFSKDPSAKTTAESATNAYKYVISALRHFTSLPYKPWKKDHNANGGYYNYGGQTPHRINDIPSGVHIFSGSTADARKHLLYRKITDQMGHLFINTAGTPIFNTRQERIWRRTGRV